MREMMSCALMVVLLLYCQGRLAQTGDGLFINVRNHRIVTLEDIGPSESQGLKCETTVADCCNTSAANTGDWFSPNGTIISNANSDSIYQVKGPGYVGLQRNSGGAEGIYRCEIGPSGNKKIYYAGLYFKGNGAPDISDQLQFSFVSATTSTFSLTCISTDGPATKVIWRRNGVQLFDDNNHIFSQRVVNTHSAQYNNVLTVTGKRPGNYQCSVINDIGIATSPIFEGIAPGTPIILNKVEVTSTSVSFSWNPVESDVTVLEYQVFYQRTIGVNQIGCELENDGISMNRNVNSNVIEYTINGLEEFSTYDVSVVAVNVFGPSELSYTKQIKTNSAAPTGAPNRLQIIASDETSISVQWKEIPCRDRNSNIIHYIIEYGNTTSATVTVSEPTLSVTITNLEPDTRYSIRVAAVNELGQMGPFSAAITAETNRGPEITFSTGALIGAILGSIFGTFVVYTAILVAFKTAVYFWKKKSTSNDTAPRKT